MLTLGDRRINMAWIFQGNPNRYDIDEYLARYSYIYWSAPTNQNEIAIGDIVYIWRAGSRSGVIANGIIREQPVVREKVQYPDALGDELWFDQHKELSEVVVGIAIVEVRLTSEEGMIERSLLKTHPVFGKNRIITNPVGTIFHLAPEETNALTGLWKLGFVDTNVEAYTVMEGTPQLKSHFRRERSQKLIAQKKEQYKKTHKTLRCEICDMSFEESYPKSLGENFIEAHHKIPLAQINQVVRNSLDDLLLVCSNCHRMIHRTKDVESNLYLLLSHFGKK
jgi:hypothetical protein